MSQPGDKWLEWQRDHAAALAALQEAQRAYHRVFVERALASRRESAVDGPQETVPSPSLIERSATEVQQKLDAVDAARVRLDAVRARKPG
jgi:LmbE family N-acetylglucosaminyl deacetylase